MIEVQDMPESDSEEGESMDGAEEAEDDERESEEGDQERQDLKEGRTGAFNEEAGQEKISDRLEAVRISRALGNDDTNQPSHEPPDDLSDLEPESDSDSQASSTGPPATDFTTYIRERKVRPPRISAKHLGEKDGVQIIVARERARTERGGGLNKGVGAGKVKGHKWKSSEKYLVGKNSGW
jgi:RIO kinase 2